MFAAIAGLATAAVGAYSAYQQKKAGEEAAQAIQDGKADPQALAQLAREEGKTNARESLALENELTPENQQLRRRSVEGLLNQINQPGDELLIENVDKDLKEGGDATQSELLTESIAKARSDLALGGTLDVDTRNEVTRNAIAKGGNTGNARYTAPRDLGLTSLQLQERRLQAGGQFGTMDQQRRQTSFENLQKLRQLREQLVSGRQGRGVQLAAFGQTLQPPDIGLSGGEIAGVTVGNQNLLTEASLQKAQNRSTNATNLANTIMTGVGAVAPYFSKDP